jgi:hypothetical protein
MIKDIEYFIITIDFDKGKQQEQPLQQLWNSAVITVLSKKIQDTLLKIII